MFKHVRWREARFIGRTSVGVRFVLLFWVRESVRAMERENKRSLNDVLGPLKNDDSDFAKNVLRELNK